MDRIASTTLIAAVIGAGSCAGPLEGYDATALQREVVARARAGAADRDAGIAEPRFVGDRPDLKPDPELIRKLDEMSGPARFADHEVDTGKGLDGDDSPLVRMTLLQAVQSAVRHNLDVELARVVPAIRATQITEAEADFDVVAFSSLNVQKTDQPQQASALNGVPIGSDLTKRDDIQFEAGLRKRIQFGGTVELSTGFNYLNDQSPRLEFTPDPASTARIAASLSQPLLRDFGREVNLARIKLAENATQRDALALRQRLLDVVVQAEEAYWNLFVARQDLAILERLLEETLNTREEVINRRELDVNPVQLAQAEREVRSRQVDVIQARTVLRDASDTLKSVMDTPDLPLIGEAVVEPVDPPDEVPQTWNLRHAVVTAVRSRPELGQALIDIADARLRRDVAANQELPRLDLQAEVRHFGLNNEVGLSYGELSENDFIEYLVGLQFEQAIGNRAGKAVSKRTRLAERAQAIRYRTAARNVVLEVKQALRSLSSTYQAFRIARNARRAAAANLEALLERERLGEGLTPEFLLDLKLRTQQALAEAERREIRSIVDYNIARSRFHRATGRLLEERGIEIEGEQDAAGPLGVDLTYLPAMGREPVDRVNGADDAEADAAGAGGGAQRP